MVDTLNQTHKTEESSFGGGTSQHTRGEPQPQGNKRAARNEYSHARRAADQHSIIFEEDLDSDGELERSTYYRQPVKNFSLNEEKIGQSHVDESETEHMV